jgi:hypothetical protein
VNVRVVARGPEVTFWVESPRGDVLPGRKVALTVSSGVIGPAEDKDGRSKVIVRELKGPATISVVDVETQVIGLAEVKP